MPGTTDLTIPLGDDVFERFEIKVNAVGRVP